MHPRLYKGLTSSNGLCSVAVAIFWRDLCLAFRRPRNNKVPANPHSLEDAPNLVVLMWSSLIKASLQSSSFSSPPWIELALPYILELQYSIKHTMNPSRAPPMASAYLTCFTTHVLHSGRITTLPAQLAPLAAWLSAPDQIAWGESINEVLLARVKPVYLQAGLTIAASACHQLQHGQSRLCCCSVPADHADYTSGRDFTEYNWAGEQVMTYFLTGLLVHHLCLPSRKLMILQRDAAVAAAAAKAAAEGAAAAEEGAFAVAEGAGPDARAKEEHAGGQHAMAELIRTSAVEREPADVQVSGVHSAGREPASAGSGVAGAAPPPGAEGAQLAAEGIGEIVENAARAGGVGEGEEHYGGRGAAAAGRGEGAAAAGGGGGRRGGRAAPIGARGTGAGATAAAVTEGIITTAAAPAAAAAGGGAGEGGAAAAEGKRGKAATSEGAAAVAGGTGQRPDAAAQAWTQSSAATSIPSAGSSKHKAVGGFSAGLLWLACAFHAESLGETLAEYHAEDPTGSDNVDYVVLKVLVELLLLQTGVTGGPSLDTATQVMP